MNLVFCIISVVQPDSDWFRSFLEFPKTGDPFELKVWTGLNSSKLFSSILRLVSQAKIVS